MTRIAVSCQSAATYKREREGPSACDFRITEYSIVQRLRRLALRMTGVESQSAEFISPGARRGISTLSDTGWDEAVRPRSQDRAVHKSSLESFGALQNAASGPFSWGSDGVVE
jgi:hypothetical protein